MDRHWRGIESDVGPACLVALGGRRVRPRLIPRSEIDSLAAEMIARHGGRAGEVAFSEEHLAWRNSEPFEQGKWRRVRKRIWRLETSAKK
jgi:hypothetical protein